MPVICLTTKAIHLELVMDLSTEAFISALKRFVSRRGTPSSFLTDNGTNFVGARRHQTELYELLNSRQSQESVSQYLLSQRIDWSHSPARSPHFGGIWEAGVKQMKALLLKHLGVQKLTTEEMYTILTEVVNSRPLVPMDSTPVDGAQVLTPAYFLISRPMKALLEQPDTRPNISALRRWNLCTRLTHDLWDQWSQEYLHQLQQHYRWKHQKRYVQTGDVVLLNDKELFLHSWPLAVVEKVHPGKDGLMRVVTLRTSKGTYDRSVIRVVPLLSDDAAEDTSSPPKDVRVQDPPGVE